jgi:hypothetical protein
MRTVIDTGGRGIRHVALAKNSSVNGGISEVPIISSVIASTRAQSVSEVLFVLDAFIGKIQTMISEVIFAFIFVPFKAHKN